MLELEKAKAKLEELDAAKEYLKPSYYWKRHRELCQLVDLLIRVEDIRRFNQEQST